MKNVLKILVVSIVFFTLNSCTKEASFGEGLNTNSKNVVSGLNSSGSSVIASSQANCTWNVNVNAIVNSNVLNGIGFSNGNWGGQTVVNVNVKLNDGSTIPVMANIVINYNNQSQSQNNISFDGNSVSGIEIIFNGNLPIQIGILVNPTTTKNIYFTPDLTCYTTNKRRTICYYLSSSLSIEKDVVNCTFL
jgi:hypothetical protein